MNTPAEAILVLQTLAERGFRVRVKGDQLRAIGDGRPPTPMLSDLRRLKQVVLALAAQGLTWRCQVILWPRRTWEAYRSRVRAFEEAGFPFSEAERLAYPEFALWNVVMVEPDDRRVSAGTTGKG